MINTSAMKLMPCIFHPSPLHMDLQIIFSPLVMRTLAEFNRIRDPKINLIQVC
jgi:hypothetical protein